MKKVFLLTIYLFCGSIYAEKNLTQELILLHTNDHHGAILPSNGLGGLAEIGSVIKGIKDVNPNVILVDAGDINTGSALSNMFKAKPDILAYNIMGYDAVVFGNHEFDRTLEELKKQISIAKFPFVSSNIINKDSSFLGGNRYIVKKYGDIKVGIFGITTAHTKVVANPDTSLIFLDEIASAGKVIDILRGKEKVDIVIALTHLGDIKESKTSPTSKELAAAVKGIDIIVDGHSHTYMEKPLKVYTGTSAKKDSTWIVSANEWSKYLGYGKLTVQNKRLVGFSWAPIKIGANDSITGMLKPYIEKADSAFKKVIGTAKETFIFGNRLPRYQETALGNMICDANAWYLKENGKAVDFVLHNGGNIRTELPKGNITQERILTILPFDNYLYTASMSGKDIIKLFNFIATIPQGAGGFPQLSGNVRVTIDKTKGSGVVKELTIGGKPIDSTRVYTFGTNGYTLNGGDDYEIMKTASNTYDLSLVLSYVVTEYIKAKDSINPLTDGRITIIGGVKP